MKFMKPQVKAKIKSILRLFVLTPVVAVAFMFLYGISQGMVFYIDRTNGLTGGVIALVCALVIICCYALYRRVLDKSWPYDLNPKTIGKDLPKGLAIGFLYFCIIAIVLGICGYYKIDGVSGNVEGLLRMLGFYFLVGTAEEIVFRGIIFREIDRRFGTVIALVISGLIFGFLHIMNPGATVWSSIAIAIEAGLLLGAAYKYSGTLWLPIGIHWAWNYTQGNIFGFAVSGTLDGVSFFDATISGPAIMTGGSFGPEASIISVVLGTVVTTIFIFLYHKNIKKLDETVV